MERSKIVIPKFTCLENNDSVTKDSEFSAISFTLITGMVLNRKTCQEWGWIFAFLLNIAIL